MTHLHFAACVLAAAAAAFGQDDGIDLLAADRLLLRHHLSLYVPKVPPQITCIRSDEQATTFSLAAWGEDKPELHVDFRNEQVLAIAWGALRFDESSAGWATELLCEQLRLEAEGLTVRLRTVIPPGPGIDLPLDSKAAGRTWYPSLFLRTPRTERVAVDVVGSRRRDRKVDFQPVAGQALEVRLHPDETPAREQLRLLGSSDAFDQPQVLLAARADAPVLDLAWGKLGPGAYHLDLIAASIRDGVLHATVRAENRPIMLYSGPGEHHPGLRLQLPPVNAVRLHIVRVGDALPEGTADFTPSKSEQLVVTVDHGQVRRRDDRR